MTYSLYWKETLEKLYDAKKDYELKQATLAEAELTVEQLTKDRDDAYLELVKAKNTYEQIDEGEFNLRKTHEVQSNEFQANLTLS